MKPNPFSLFSAILMAIPLSASAQIYSWETDTQGWTAGGDSSIATSTIGATDGLQSLAITQPMSNMWYSVAAAVNPDLPAMFTDATELSLDVTYPNPGYNSWWGDASVEIIIQGEKVGWTPLGTKAVPVDGAAHSVSWPLSVTQAHNMATSGWGQVLLKFTYGNGGATVTETVFYVDNFDHTVVTVPAPTPDLYWKGDIDDSWASANWSTDEAGTEPLGGALLPADGSTTVAFSATGATNLSNVLGAPQNVKGIVVTDGTEPVSISGANNLTLGENGIWITETGMGLYLDSAMNVILGTDQAWWNKSSGEITVDSIVSGTGQLTKIGAGSLRLNNVNTYSGGTKFVQGTVILGDDAALGATDAVLSMESGTLELNGFNPTVGGIDGVFGGAIVNSSAFPSVLTINEDFNNTYTCAINGDISVVKMGFGNTTSNALGNFTGDLTVMEGTFTANAGAWGTPIWSSFGNAQVAGRQITVESDGTVLLANGGAFGDASGDPALLPEIVINGGYVESNRYNIIGDVTLNGGNLLNASTDDGDYKGYQFRGRINVIGNLESVIDSSNGKGNHLSENTLIEVANVSASEDLLVYAPLVNQSGNFGNAAGGFTLTGPGSMLVSSICTYTGNTTVSSESTLALDAGAGLKFAPKTNGASNQVTGAGTVTLNGDFTIELTDAAVADGNSWTLVNVETLTESFGESFTVTSNLGAFTEDANVWTLVDGGNTWTFSEATGVLSLSVEASSSPFANWALLKGLNGSAGLENGATNDPENDGIQNALEFVFDGDPLASDPSKLPAPSEDATNFYFDFDRRDDSVTEVALALEYGTTLAAWPSSVEIPADDTPIAGPPVTITDIDGTTHHVRVTVAKSGNAKLFGRLKAVK